MTAIGKDAPHSGRAPAGFDPSRSATLADFTGEYRAAVCKIGQGAACCRYLTMGADGWGCAKRSTMRYSIDSRVESMSAKGDNCRGVYEPQPAFALLREHWGHPAGTLVYRCKDYDYGLASDDTRATGKPHTSMTLDPSGDYPSFTVPDEDLAPAIATEAGTAETPKGGSVHEGAVPERQSPKDGSQ